jgi:prepilin-type N-terminal cleavage/methylation domain-containing protein
MTPTNTAHRVHGFTLVEIAIVMLIVGLILAAIMKGESLIQESRVQDAMAIAADLSTASRTFKQRYHYLPGDFVITAASPEIPNVAAACMSGGANAGNGDGAISAAESPCVPQHLFAAGFIKGGTGTIRSQYGAVQVIANAASQTALGANPLPPNIQNVVEFASLPCEVAQQIDRNIDDANLATGNARASVASCTPQGANDPVPFFAMAL